MTTGLSIGDAVGRVIIDSSGVRAGINEAKRSINNGFRDIGAGVSQVGGAITALTAPLSAFGLLGVRNAGNFDDAMRELSARTGIVGADLERMKQAAIDAGAATVFSATDAAASLLQLTSSGLSAEDALAVLPAVMNGAAAAGTNLGDTADWITDIMAAFGLEADQAYYVMESLSDASQSGSASVSDLAMGFQNAGGVAAMFGMSVDETAAVLQIFSENGIKGAEAGTQLSSLLRALTRDTKDSKDAWSELGVSLYDTSGNVRDFDAVIDDLNLAMADMTQEEQIGYMRRLADGYSVAGFQALLASGGIDEMQASMDGAADMATVAESKMGGWRGMLENLSGSFETFQIQVLTPFINDHLIPLGNQAADIVNKMTAWAAANPELSNTIVMIVAALAVLGPTLVIVGAIIQQVTSIFGGLKLIVSGVGTVIGALSWPVALAILAVALLAAAWYTNFGGIRDKVQEVVDYVKPKLTEMIDALKNADVAGAVDVVKGMATDVQTAVSDALPGIQAKIDEWATAFVTWATESAPDLLVELGDLAERVRVWIGAKATSLTAKLGEWGAAFTAWVVPAIAALLLELPSIMATITTWILEHAPDIAAQILDWATEFVKWVAPTAADLIEELGVLLSDVTEWIVGDLIPAFLAESPGMADAFLDFVNEMITDVIPKLGEFLKTVQDEITNTLIPAITTAAIDIGKGLVNGIWDGINQLWDNFTSDLEDKLTGGIIGQAVDLFGINSPSKVFRDLIGKNIVAGLAAGLSDFGPVESSMQHLIAATMPDSLTQPVGLQPAGQPSGGRQIVINVTVTPDMIRDQGVIEQNADLFGEKLAAMLAAQG